jgi:hypothetical protein
LRIDQHDIGARRLQARQSFTQFRDLRPQGYIASTS